MQYPPILLIRDADLLESDVDLGQHGFAHLIAQRATFAGLYYRLGRWSRSFSPAPGPEINMDDIAYELLFDYLHPNARIRINTATPVASASIT